MLVVAQNFIGWPIIDNRQLFAMNSNFFELIGETAD
jgi:hypothetical protein